MRVVDNYNFEEFELAVSQVIKGVGPEFYFVPDVCASGKNSSIYVKNAFVLGPCCSERVN